MNKKFDAVVIGSGPGGYVCAIRLAQLGKKTAIVEKENLGGVCLNVGCIPSKALIYAANQYHKITHEFPKMGISASDVSIDMGKLQEWKNQVVNKLTTGVGGLLKANGVEIIKGTASFSDSKTIQVESSEGTLQVEAESFVIATGSRVFEIPSLPFNGKNIISSTEALELSEIPKTLIIIGGGFIGLEIGFVYAKLGSQVKIVEALDRLLSTVEKDLVRVVEKNMKRLGMKIFTNTKAHGLIETDPLRSSELHLIVQSEGGGKETLEGNVILVSVGRKPNSDGIGLEKIGVSTDKGGNIPTNSQGQTNVPGIYAIGDVTGAPQLAHRAMMDGTLVAAGIAGEKSYKDYKTVPWAVFCDPEIATVGLTEDQAKEQGFKYKIGMFPFAANGRALSTNESEGFIKVLINEEDESLLGVHMVGPEVSNLIAEAALAIEMGATAEDIIRTIHTHPTLPEAFPEAVEQAFGKAIHIYKPARRK